MVGFFNIKQDYLAGFEHMHSAAFNVMTAVVLLPAVIRGWFFTYTTRGARTTGMGSFCEWDSYSFNFSHLQVLYLVPSVWSKLII